MMIKKWYWNSFQQNDLFYNEAWKKEKQKKKNQMKLHEEEKNMVKNVL